MANLTLRSSTNQPLSFAELDGNFEYFTGSHAVTGSLTATQGFIGNVTGTASYASTSSYVLNAVSASFSTLAQTSNTASYITTAQTASYVLQAVSSSYAATASVLLGSIQSASYASTSSYISPTFISASAAASGFSGGGGSTNTSSLLVTASFSDPNLTFEKGNGSTFNVDISTLTVTNASTASYIDPTFAFNGGKIDAEIYLSPQNTNTNYPILFSSVTSNLGGYGYPSFDQQPTIFTYNPNTNILRLTGSLVIDSLFSLVVIANLPTTEPTSSGQLWISGSTGSNSKFLCVRN
jgi:hypothetical protein